MATFDNQPAFDKKSTDRKPTWQLYGTLGCHLCEMAEDLLIQAQAVADFTFEKVDIADLPETQMLEFASKIPVLVTPQKKLFYPFSIMDILAITH